MTTQDYQKASARLNAFSRIAKQHIHKGDDAWGEIIKHPEFNYYFPFDFTKTNESIVKRQMQKESEIMWFRNGIDKRKFKSTESEPQKMIGGIYPYFNEKIN